MLNDNFPALVIPQLLCQKIHTFVEKTNFTNCVAWVLSCVLTFSGNKRCRVVSKIMSHNLLCLQLKNEMSLRLCI